MIDRFIKYLVISHMDEGESFNIIKNFFSVTYVKNDGAAFSILSSHTFVLIILSIAVLIYLSMYVIRNDLKKVEKISYGMIFGGILGNLYDRIIYGSVIDFLDFNLFGINWPIFNFADICIVLSMGLIIIEMVKGEMHELKSRRG